MYGVVNFDLQKKVIPDPFSSETIHKLLSTSILELVEL